MKYPDCDFMRMGNYRRLPLECAINARDLGGYPTKDGMITRYGVFVRSELPGRPSPYDVVFMDRYGMERCIDLRSRKGATLEPSGFRCCGMRYSIVSLGSLEVEMESVGISFKGIKEEWPKIYTAILEDHKDWVAEVIDSILSDKGCTVFHCNLGKDRTGLVSALLLSLANVSDEDVIADYSVSEIFLRPKYQEFMKQTKMLETFFSSDAANMRHVLDHIKREYRSTEKYLESCGVSEATMSRILERFLDRA